MQRYFLKRLVSTFPTLLIIAVVGFILIHLRPGDPVSLALGGEADEQQVAQVRKLMGLDDPLVLQFPRWFARFVTRLDLGVSIQLNRPVNGLLLSRAEPTLLLAGLGFALALLMGVGAGVTAACNHGRVRDQTIIALSSLGMSMPVFWFGLILILLFSVKFGLFPVAGYTPLAVGVLPAIRSVFLPALALGLIEAGLIARMTRNTLLEVLAEDYVRTARSKGLSEMAVVYKHALRNAMGPVATVAGLSVARLMGGSVVLEDVFAIPGIGRMLLTAITKRDYPVIQGVVLLLGLIYMAVNLFVDLFYAYTNPRLRSQ